MTTHWHVDLARAIAEGFESPASTNLCTGDI
jgi:hypothetical protein